MLLSKILASGVLAPKRTADNRASPAPSEKDSRLASIIRCIVNQSISKKIKAGNQAFWAAFLNMFFLNTVTNVCATKQQLGCLASSVLSGLGERSLPAAVLSGT